MHAHDAASRRISNAWLLTGSCLPALAAMLLAAAGGCGTPPSPSSAPPPVAPAAPDGSPYVPAGYVQVFGDEFNGARLDTNKWWTRYIYNNGMLDTLNDERQLYREHTNHVFTGSELQLVARVKESGKPRFRYESGMLRSKDTFKYGYFEIRAKVPGAKGVWPAFWLNSDASPEGKLSWPPEIDIFEFVNNVKDDRPDMLHMGAVVHAKKGQPNPWDGTLLYTNACFRKGYYYAPFNFPDAYHVYALLWDTDDTVTWFVDGVRLYSIRYKWMCANGQEAPNAHVLLNLAIGGQWAGRYGVDDAAFPQAFEIDYLRVYQKPDHRQVGRSTMGRDLIVQP